MPTYTRTQTVEALRWTDDLSAEEVVQWVSLRGGRAHRASIESPHDQVMVSSRAVGHSYLRRGDWVIESPTPAGTRPHDPLVSFVACDPETFTREGWTLLGPGRSISTQHMLDELVDGDELRCPSDGATFDEHYDRGFTDGQKESEQLRTLIKLLCSDVSPYGSEAFQRVRDQVNPETQALLLSVLDAVPQPKPIEELGVQDVTERNAGDAVMAAGGYAVPLFPQPDGTVKVGRSPESEHDDAVAEIERLRDSVRKWKSGCGEWMGLAVDAEARADDAEERLERIKRIFRDE